MSSSKVLATPGVSVRLIKKQNVVLNFSDIARLKSVTYEVRYTNKGKEEGAVGTIRPKKASDSRTIYLGTCSKRVCTPHNSITEGTVEVVFKPTSGKATVKRFRLKF